MIAMLGHVGSMIGAAVNLNHPTHYVTMGWFQISVSNLIVIILMFVVFVAALLLPFPGGRAPDRAAAAESGQGKRTS